MYKQLIYFNKNEMGAKKGYCLQNVRKGFNLPPKFESAKADMEFNKNQGTLHNIDTLPENVSVPVYVDTTSKYEHIIVSDRGTFYSDGKKISKNKYKNYFGWGEYCEGYHVVEKTFKQNLYKVVVDVLNIRKSPKISAFNKVGKAYKNTQFDILEIEKNGKYTWGRAIQGWVCLEFNNKKYCQKVGD